MKLKKLFKSMLAFSAAAVMGLSMVSCNNDNSSSSAESTAKSSSSDTSGKSVTKSFVITLYPDYAPITCENFEKLVKDKFYDGLTFHRIYPGFMAQGGAPKGDGTDTIKGEFTSNGVDNRLSHVGYIVSMARSDDYDSASSQFFICFNDIAKKNTAGLNGNYAAFGKVTEGTDTIDDLEKVEVQADSSGEVSSPVNTVKIDKAEMIDDDSEGHHRVKFTVSFTEGTSSEESSEETAEATASEESK